MDPDQARIIEEHPIGNGLDAFRASFRSLCEERSIAWCPPDTVDLALDQLEQEDVQGLALSLLAALQGLRAPRLLRSSGRNNNLFRDLIRFASIISSDDFDIGIIRSLFNVVLTGPSDDALIWGQVYHLVAEPAVATPPRPTAPLSFQETPWSRNTGSFANSSEYRKHVDGVLQEELGAMHVGLPRFYEIFFGGVAGLQVASEAVFGKCQEGDNPLFSPGTGWRGWPKGANQDDVLAWFAKLSDELAAFAKDHSSNPAHQRRPLAQPNMPIQGSTAERKLDIGFVKDPRAGKDSQYHWSQILVPGELKSNPSADIASKAWLDLGRYAREVLAAQDTRRFVLGFTLCGSLMRIWEFDRLGGIASERFDINKDAETGLQFVSTILGFLWMSEEQLGFDPTITVEAGRQVVEIQRNGETERLILDKLMARTPCVSGRATTCWKAHHEDDPQTPLVVKDSWQYTEREEEGELLRDATSKGVVNVARYYHHETVHVHSRIDDVRNNVRGGLNLADANTWPLKTDSGDAIGGDKSRSGSITSVKRTSSQINARGPPSKRSRSEPSTSRTSRASGTDRGVLPNRVHRRVIVRDYGRPIYKANSPAALLAAFEGCIRGHESLHKAGFLHRDISVYNLLINEDGNNPSWPSFLIDLDLAVEERRLSATGAKGKTGTRVFMAIGALRGARHSFMHDLESFFWVLFWICIHYDGSGKGRVVPAFDKWNYGTTEDLATTKLGTVAEEAFFMEKMSDNFTPYYQQFIPLLNELRKVVFPNNRAWVQEDEKLYSRMVGVLQKGRESLS